MKNRAETNKQVRILKNGIPIVFCYFLIYAICLSGCRHKKAIDSFKFPFEFDKTQWKLDSLACNGYRQRIIDSLVTNESKIRYKVSIDTILSYLTGYSASDSSSDGKNYYYYWAEPGYHCEADLSKKGELKKAMNSESFLMIVADKKRNIVSDIINGIP